MRSIGAVDVHFGRLKCSVDVSHMLERLVSSRAAGRRQAPRRRVALVMGNGASKHAVKLPNPQADAEAMAGLLKSMGFEVVPGTNLGRDAIAEKLSEFARVSAGADVSLLFYAGHGMQLGGKNLLVPVDAGLKRELDAKTRTIEIDSVPQDTMAGAKVKLVLLDARRRSLEGIDVHRRLSWQHPPIRRGRQARIRPGSGWHAMTIAGYDDRRAAFRLLNFWGTSWADGGYGWAGHETVLTDALRRCYRAARGTTPASAQSSGCPALGIGQGVAIRVCPDRAGSVDNRYIARHRVRCKTERQSHDRRAGPAHPDPERSQPAPLAGRRGDAHAARRAGRRSNSSAAIARSKSATRSPSR